MAGAEIAGAISSLNATLQVVKAMIGLRDAEAFRANAIELQSVLADALAKSVTASIAQAEQLDRVKALETEVAQLKAWNTERQDYELIQVAPGAVAYMLKPSARGSAPPHWLCPACYNAGKKAILQPTGDMPPNKYYTCHPCGAKICIPLRFGPRWLSDPAEL